MPWCKHATQFADECPNHQRKSNRALRTEHVPFDHAAEHNAAHLGHCGDIERNHLVDALVTGEKKTHKQAAKNSTCSTKHRLVSLYRHDARRWP